jgi:hypothetical protein
MIGYTFTYMAGFIKNERIVKLIASKEDIGQKAGADKIPDIVGQLNIHMSGLRSSNKVITDPVYNLATYFFNVVIGEFYWVGQNPAQAYAQRYGGNTSNNQATALIHFSAFINGIFAGQIQGADVMFAVLFNSGYQVGWEDGYDIGYSNGFRDGYSQGYAAGWQSGYQTGVGEGYNAGYQSGHDAGAQAWSGIGNIINNIGGVIGDSGKVGQILDNVATIGEVIGGLM